MSERPRPKPIDSKAVLQETVSSARQMGRQLSGLLSDLDHGDIGLFHGDVAAAKARLKAGIGRSPDVVLRTFTIGGRGGCPALLVYVQGLAASQIVDQDFLALAEVASSQQMAEEPAERAKMLADSVAVGHATTERKWSALLKKAVAGNALVFLEDCPDVLVLDTVQYPARAIDRPETEQSIRGSQEALNEVLLTQMNQMRRLLQTERLVFEPSVLGRMTGTRIALAYLDGVTNPALVESLRRRLKGLAAEEVLTQARVSSALRDHPWSPFPLTRASERVDFVAREVMVGRVALLMENVPFAQIVPATFVDFFRTSMDYGFSFWEASLSRLIRVLGFFLGVYAPAFYVALTTVEPDLLPSKLLLSVAGSREGVPFPPVVEVILMFAVIELLREAAIRLPKSMNQTLGTVGAIVIGTSIVSAGVVSDQMIVLITLTAVGVFTAPAWELTTAVRWLVWPMVLAAYVLGVYGMALMTLLLIQHLAGLSSFGVPYLAPYGPWRPVDMGDAMTRAPLRDLTRRPMSLWPLLSRKGQGEPAVVSDVPLRRMRRRWRT